MKRTQPLQSAPPAATHAPGMPRSWRRSPAECRWKRRPSCPCPTATAQSGRGRASAARWRAPAPRLAAAKKKKKEKAAERKRHGGRRPAEAAAGWRAGHRRKVRGTQPHTARRRTSNPCAKMPRKRPSFRPMASKVGHTVTSPPSPSPTLSKMTPDSSLSAAAAALDREPAPAPAPAAADDDMPGRAPMQQAPVERATTTRKRLHVLRGDEKK